VLCQVPVDVASYLLNEKRTEIAKIELKQRINVLMVPNKSLETPNYKLERLKHDDPRLDGMEVSYKLAEEVETPLRSRAARRSRPTSRPPSSRRAARYAGTRGRAQAPGGSPSAGSCQAGSRTCQGRAQQGLLWLAEKPVRCCPSGRTCHRP